MLGLLGRWLQTINETDIVHYNKRYTLALINALEVPRSVIEIGKKEMSTKLVLLGREPWSIGHGRRLTFRRSWVRISVPYTGWTWHFFKLICCKNCNDVCLKRPKINEKEDGVGPFLKLVLLPFETEKCFFRSLQWRSHLNMI